METTLLGLLVYTIISLFCSAVYYNTPKPLSKDQLTTKLFHHVMLWAVPIFWAIYLKNSLSMSEPNYTNGQATLGSWERMKDKSENFLEEHDSEDLCDTFEMD